MPASRRLLATLATAIVLVAGLWIVYRQFAALSFAAVESALASQSRGAVIAALLCTAVSFACLASYDAFAARIAAPGRVSLARALAAGAASHAVSNLLGFHAVTGTAVRYRLFRQVGLPLGDIGRIISLSSAALALGFAAMLALALLVEPFVDRAFDTRWALGGVALGAALLGLLAWLARGERTLTIVRFRIVLPPARLAAVQMLIGAVETAAATGALYVLLPADLAPPFAQFSIAMIFAVLLGVAGHTPGGLGVFDATIVSLLGGNQRADVLAALLTYRVIYNVLPFVLAVVAMAVFELVHASKNKWLSSRANGAERSETRDLL